MASVAAPTREVGRRQIPIVCPGHTRPLAELQFRSINDTSSSSSSADKDATSEEKRTFLVSACHDKMPMLRDGTTGDWIGTFAGHKGAVWSCRLDPQAYLAGTASGDFSVRVWDAINGKSLWVLPHKHIVKTLDFSEDSERLATGGHEGILRVFDLRGWMDNNNNEKNENKEEERKEGTKGKEEGMDPALMLHQREDKKVTISKLLWKDANTVFAACSDGCIRVWNVTLPTTTTNTTPCFDATRLLHTIVVEEGSEVRDMELTRLAATDNEKKEEKRCILTVAAGTMVSFYDVGGHEEAVLLKQHKMPIHFRDEGGASLHPQSGKKFIAGGSDLWVRVFDYETGEQLECLKGHHGPVRCLRYAPDGNTYATGSEDGTIRLWKTDA